MVAASGDGDALFGAFALNGVNQAVLPRDPARPPTAQGSLERFGVSPQSIQCEAQSLGTIVTATFATDIPIPTTSGQRANLAGKPVTM